MTPARTSPVVSAPRRTRVSVFIAPVLGGLLGLGALVLGATYLLARPTSRDGELAAIEQRLARLERALGASASSHVSPVFVEGPHDSGTGNLADAVASLSRQLADLRDGKAGEGQGLFERAASADPGTRRRSVRALLDAARIDPEARVCLRAMLKDTDARVRREVLGALEDLGDPSTLAEVAELLNDTDPAVRGRAALALADIAEDSQDPGNRARAASALGPSLGDADPRVREDAAKALRDMAGTEAVPGLTAALKDDRFEVRSEALRGLGEIADPSTQAVLREAYGNGSGPNALDAALALKRAGDPSAFTREAERLRGLARTSGDPDERRMALRLLAENEPTTSRALLEQALRDPSDAVRREAQRALERR
jgi:HEAT repeat protein